MHRLKTPTHQSYSQRLQLLTVSPVYLGPIFFTKGFTKHLAVFKLGKK